MSVTNIDVEKNILKAINCVCTQSHFYIKMISGLWTICLPDYLRTLQGLPLVAFTFFFKLLLSQKQVVL